MTTKRVNIALLINKSKNLTTLMFMCIVVLYISHCCYILTHVMTSQQSHIEQVREEIALLQHQDADIVPRACDCSLPGKLH